MFLKQHDRHVIPRWRAFTTTVLLGELDNAKQRQPISVANQQALVQRLSEWETNHTIWHAGDLLSSAFVVGDSTKFKEAARFVIENQLRVPAPLLSLAEKLLQPESDKSHNITLPAEEEQLSKAIHQLRTGLSEEPRNAILWVELSRLYALLGEGEHAIKCMNIAAALGPDNRFIVRSAARLFLHEHDSKKALSVIRKAVGAKRDPWLLAAEVAVASVSHSPSILAKIGKVRNDDDDLSLFDRNELSSALATLELESGKHRKARQLFRRALAAPNENTVAQVEWANRQIGSLDVGTPSNLGIPLSFEASAQVSLVKGDWMGAIEHGQNWLLDQPFSKRPALFTSYVTSLTEEYGNSIKLLYKSLKANPKDEDMRNNLAFALASSNRISEAEAVLKGTDYRAVTGISAVTLAATHGLVLFRSGSPNRGRELYELAIQRAGQLGFPKYRTMAILYLAREELLAHTSNASAFAHRVLSEALNSNDNEVLLIAGQVSRLRENISGVRQAI